MCLIRRVTWNVLALVVITSVVPATREARATDLGQGNRKMKERFDAYMKRGIQLKGPSKEATTRRVPRVLVTGFGLFTGVDFNISGVVAECLGSRWPEVTALRGKAANERLKLTDVPDGRLVDDDLGGKAWQRQLVLGERRIELGVLLLDVLWDLAPAIALEEAKAFQPDLIVMMGRGSRRVVFEAGAVNHAAAHAGFRSDGEMEASNLPRTHHVIDPALKGAESAIAMRWDGAAMARAARPHIAGIGRKYEVYVAPRARPENNYICNNISCAVLHGIKLGALPLAGGAIRVEAIRLPNTVAGFLHLPERATREADEIVGWCRAVLAAIDAQLSLKTASPASAGADAAAPRRPAER